MRRNHVTRADRFVLTPHGTIGACALTVLLLAGPILSSAGAGEVITLEECRVSAYAKVALSAELLGILSHVGVREGDVVHRGQLLAQVKDDAARQLLTTAEMEADNDIDLRYTQKLSELSTLEYTRARELNQEIPGAKSQSEVLRLRLAAEQATLQVEQASHQLDLAVMRKKEAQIALDSYRVRTPIGGVVLQVHKRDGEAVNAGDPIAVIANFDRMRVEGFLPVDLSWQVKRQQPVRIRITGLGSVPEIHRRTFNGVISFVDPVINEVSQQVRVWAEVENLGGLLKDGLIASMEIDVQPSTERQTSIRQSPGFRTPAR